MVHPLLTVLIACTGAEPEVPQVPWAGETLASDTASTAIQLDKVEGTYTIPATNLPDGVISQTEFILTNIKAKKGKRRRKSKGISYHIGIPFSLPENSKRFRPPGMRVFVGEKELPYSANPAHQTEGRPAWRIQGVNLVVTYPRQPEAVRIVHPKLQQDLARLTFEQSGMEPAEFARYELTLRDQSRQGLLLPPPGKVEWTLKVPSNGVFRAWLAMERNPLKDALSSGANVALAVVTADGKSKVLGHKQIPGRTPSYDRWEVDLSEFSGQEVTLRLKSLAGPEDDESYDHVFVGSPVIFSKLDNREQVRRVVYIGLDTTRPDHFGAHGYKRDTTPNLDAFADKAVLFDTAYTPAPRTRPSFRTSTTGRWPLNAVGAKNISEVFRDNGWATGGFAANVHLTSRFDFHEGYDVWWLDPRAKANQQVDRTLQFLQDNVDRDAFVFMHIMDPHIFYRAPDEFNARFVTDPDPDLPKMFNRWEVTKWSKTGKLSERRKKHIVDLYDAELAYTDQELGRLFAELEKLPGRTVVAIHSDHGEEFWEHDGFEHNHTLYDEVTRAVLWVQPPNGHPGGYRVSDTKVSTVDIAPTLFELAGFTEHIEELDGHSLVPLMRGERPAHFDRPLPVAHLRYGHERWAVLCGDYKYILHTGSGREEAYDMTADPAESKDIAATADLSTCRKQLGESHDMVVGPGWRIKVRLGASMPMTFKLPAKAVAADVLDPAAVAESRANLAWGEPPKRVPDDVGRVDLADDGMSFTFTPGRIGDGIVYVIYESEVAAEGLTLIRGGETLPVGTAEGKYGWASPPPGGHSVEVRPGWVNVPPEGEASRMARIKAAGEASSAEINMLEALGYVGEKGADGGHIH